MSSTSTPSIGVIICSSRQPRVCPQIASFVKLTLLTNPSFPSEAISIIDLCEWDLPMFNEPTIPAHVKGPSGYAQPHARAWSAEISKHSAFIFILPQYNWGYPAVLKNALDYLFNEWVGKPAMIVSYGGHGGSKAAVQLSQVLEGLRTKVVERMPALSFVDKEALVAATQGKDIGLTDEIWVTEREEVKKAGDELMVLLKKAVV